MPRPTPPAYTPTTYTSKGGSLTLAEFEKNFTDVAATCGALVGGSVLADASGTYLPDGSKLPVPGTVRRAIGSYAAPLASLDCADTTTRLFPLSTPLRIPAAAITPGARVSGRAVFMRSGTASMWAGVHLGALGSVADPVVTSVEFTTTLPDRALVTLYFDIDVGPDRAVLVNCHRYVRAGGDSFTAVELPDPGAGDWFVSFSSRATAVDGATSMRLVSYDLEVFP